MISEEELKQLGEIAAGVFEFSGRSVASMRDEAASQRDFSVLSVDIASRLSYFAQLVSDVADDVGTADYASRCSQSPPLVTEAAKIYLSWREI